MKNHVMFMKVICKSFELYNARNVIQHRYSSSHPAQREASTFKDSLSFPSLLLKGPQQHSLRKVRTSNKTLQRSSKTKAKGIKQIFSASFRGLILPRCFAYNGKEVPGHVPAVPSKITFCSRGPSDSSVLSRLKIHLSLGRNHSFRSKCTCPSPGRTTSLAGPPEGSEACAQLAGPGAPGGGSAVPTTRSPSRGFPALGDLPHLGPRTSLAEPLGAPGAATEGPGLCSRGFAPAPRARRAPATPPAAARAKAPAGRSSSRRPPRLLWGRARVRGPECRPRRRGRPARPPPTRARRQPGPGSASCGR